MTVKARLQVTSINTQSEWFVAVGLVPVFSSDPADPNYSYSQSTPSGQVSLNITNRAAFEQFALGQVYDIEFVPVDPAAPVEADVAQWDDTGAAPAEAPEPSTEVQGTATGFATPEEADAWSAANPAPEAVEPQEPSDTASVTDGTDAVDPVAVDGTGDGQTAVVPETPAPDASAAETPA